MRRFRWVIVVCLVLTGALAVGVTIALGLAVTPTSNPLPGSLFQGGDGNQVAPGGGSDLIDWENLVAGGVPSTTGINHTADATGSTDDIFDGGNKVLEPGDWGLTTGGASPSSNDIIDVWRTLQHEPGAGHDAFLYIAFDRAYSGSGTAALTLELNQKSPHTNSRGEVFPCRTNGDLLITFYGGSGSGTVLVQKWVTTTAAADGCATIGTLTDVGLTANDAQAAFNSSTIDNFLPSDFYRPGSTMPAGSFGEVALNLTKVFDDLGLSTSPSDCEARTFLSSWAFSRSSDSISSNLTDYVKPDYFPVTDCQRTPKLESTASADVTLGHSISDTAHLTDGLDPRGTLTFRLYGPDDTNCETPILHRTVTVNGNDSYDLPAPAFTPTALGVYRWRVTYSGDANNKPVGPTECGIASETVTVTHGVGKLIVDKTIDGPAASHRGSITVHASYDQGPSASWDIPAGQTPEQADFPHELTDIPGGAQCTVTEDPNGSNPPAVDVVASYDPSRVVEIPSGGERTVHVTDYFSHNPGKLIVDKSIIGGAAHHRGLITVHASCTGDPAQSGHWTIQPGETPEQARFPHELTDIPAHAECKVSEDPDGSTHAADVVTTVNPDRPVVIPAGGEKTVHVTNDYPDHPLKADLEMTKTSSVATVAPGDQVSYTLVVTNHGPDEASNVTVSDPLNAALTLIAALPSQGSCTGAQDVSCTMGNLPAGGSVQILVTARVSSSSSGSIPNTARVTSDTPDPDPTNNEDRVVISPAAPGTPAQPHADVQIDKTVDRATATPGQRLTYTLRVTNHGSASASHVVVTDTSAVPLTIVSVHPTQGTCGRLAPVRCSLGTLAAGASATVTIIAQARQAGSTRNTATVVAAVDDARIRNNISDAETRVKAPPRRTPPPPRVTG